MGTIARRQPKAQAISYNVEWQALSPASGLAQGASQSAASSTRHVCSWQLFQRQTRAPVRTLRACRRPPGRHSSSREELRRAARAAKGHLRQLQSLLKNTNDQGRIALSTRCGRGAELCGPGRGASSVLAAPAWALLKVLFRCATTVHRAVYCQPCFLTLEDALAARWQLLRARMERAALRGAAWMSWRTVQQKTMGGCHPS